MKNSSYLDIEKYLKTKKSIIIPLGAIEQHGRCCPIATDMFLADEISNHLQDKLDILAVPTMPFGISNEHLLFPGTISLSSITFISVIRDIVNSLYCQGFRRFYFVNAHYENSLCIKSDVFSILEGKKKTIIDVIDFWDFPEVKKKILLHFNEEGGHADATDVSLMMYLKNNLVDKNTMDDEWSSIPSAYVSRDIYKKYITKSGVIGSNQSKSSLEAGEELFKCITQCIEKKIKILEEIILE